VGPSFIRAFGDFTQGELNYWPSDDKKLPLEEFKQKDKITVDLRDNLLLFDGNRGHCVSPFEGERYSLVFFSVRTWSKIPEEEVAAAKACGIPCPTPKSMAFMQSLLGPSGKQGYKLYPSPRDVGPKAFKGKVTSSAETPLAAKRKAASSTPSPAAKKGKTAVATAKGRAKM